MSILDQLSGAKGVKDEGPNRKLAQQILSKKDKKAIKELVDNLKNSDKKIQNDCRAVLEYIGAEEPKLIALYVNDFIECLQSKNNTLVWGGMLILAQITDLKSKEIAQNLDKIKKTAEAGSVITRDNGVKVMAKLSSQGGSYQKKVWPVLLAYIKKARAKEVPQYTESIFLAVNDKNKKEFIKAVEGRVSGLSSSQLSRVKKVLKQLE